jgi:hypothetical protein
VFLTALDAGQLWETTGTSAPWTWTPLNPVALVGIARQDDWVQTHPGLDGDPSHFEVYFYAGDLVHETCSTTTSPRCVPQDLLEVTARAASSSPIDAATAHHNDVTVNTPIPDTHTRRRPTRSASDPPR